MAVLGVRSQAQSVILLRRVLVADDNPVNQKLATLLLQKLGCDVDVASSGMEAIERFGDHEYDAIFMDCQMPGLDGYETTARIRASGERGSTVAIVATTANAMAGDREKCIAAGMNDYVSKPLTIGELRRSLQAATPAQTPAPPELPLTKSAQ